MKLRNLRVNQLERPIGYDFSFITLSWQAEVEDAGAHFIKTLRVTVKKEGEEQLCYDSGLLKNYRGCQHYLNMVREPRTRYFFTIWAEAENGEQAEAESFFETGKEREEWRGSWIAPKDEDTLRMPLLYRDFVLTQAVRKARLYICGLGLYEVYLNGSKLGEEYLQPGYHSYDSFLEYQTLDMGSCLKPGKQRLSVLLGEGWYKGRFGFDGDFRNLYGDKKMCIAELQVEYADGTKDCFYTDSDWQGMTSPVLQNGIYDGEWQDDSLISSPVAVECVQGPTEKLTERTNPPIKKVESFLPVAEILRNDRELVLDFGESITGWVELEGRFAKGQKVRLQYGEVLQDGEFYRDNLRTAKAEFVYVSDGSRRIVRPTFTYYGFRYLKVEGLKDGQDIVFRAYRIMSELQQTGEIRTANPLVNRLLENTLRSQKCNFLDIPTDCPQRDERMGWTGDVAIFAPTACFHMNSSAFFRHYCKSLSAEQRRKNGEIPFFAPLPKIEPGEGINPFYVTGGACGWGDVATILPWNLYQYYGDLQLLAEQYPMMCGWVDYVTDIASRNEVPYLWQNSRQLGDWLALDNGNLNNPVGKTDTGLLASAYYYLSVCLCKKAAAELSDAREDEFEQMGERIKEAFLAFYYDFEYRLLVEPTQTACAFLLSTGLYPDSGRQYLVEELERLLAENNGKLNTGFMGTPVLCPALSENGKNEMAYELLLNEDYPGWLHEVKLGATSVWERWNSLNEDGKISGTGMNSLNHYAYGSIAEWVYRYACGFIPSMNEDICMTIRPMPHHRLGMAAGKWESIYGAFESEWRYEGDEIIYRFVIPFNAKAKIELPAGKTRVLESGTHIFIEKK